MFGIEKAEIFSRGREKVRADARDLLCFWAVRELGRKLGRTQPGVGYAVIRGEAISKQSHYHLKE
jgi:putative transposase